MSDFHEVTILLKVTEFDKVIFYNTIQKLGDFKKLFFIPGIREREISGNQLPK